MTPTDDARAGATAYQSAGRPSRLGYVFFAGLLALAAGLVWGAVERDSNDVVTKVWIFLALAAMGVPIAWHAVDFFHTIASRRGAAFGFVVVTVALATVVALFVGWVDVELKNRGSLPTIDLTRNARYSLSDETLRLLDKVDGTVYATYLMIGPGDPQDPDLRNDVVEQLHVYGTSSPRVKVAEADELRDPERAAQVKREQGVTGTSSGEDTDLIVLTYAEPGREVAPGKQKEIKVERWTFRKETPTGSRKWLGEGVISDAIYELVFQKNKAYATGGHGERAIGDFRDVKEMLGRQNVELDAKPLVLSSAGSVPDDCALLLVLAPQTPFTPEESQAVSQWLEKGRALFLAVDLQEDRTTTGLEDLLAGYGIATRTNYEVLAPRITGMMAGGKGIVQMTPQFPVFGASYADHPATKALSARAGLATYFVKSTYLEVEEDKPPPGAEPKVVVNAPDFGEGAKPFALRHSPDRRQYQTAEKDKDKTEGKLPLVATSVRKVPGDAKGERDARVIVSGDADVFSDRVSSQAPANLDLARGLVQWGLHREGLVAVSDKTLESPVVTPTDYQRRFAMGWPLFVCLLPLVAGGMVWWSRRR